MWALLVEIKVMYVCVCVCVCVCLCKTAAAGSRLHASSHRSYGVMAIPRLILSYLALDDFRSQILRSAAQSPGSAADMLRKAEISHLTD